MKPIVFVGSFVSQTACAADKRYSQASNNFQWCFLAFLKPQITVSLVPLFNRAFVEPPADPTLRFVNNQSPLPGKLNYAYRLLADTLSAVWCVARASGCKAVFFYNLEYHNILTLLCSKYLLRKQVFVVAADLTARPGSTFDRFTRALYRQVDGVLALSEGLRFNENSEVIAGLVPKSTIKIKGPLARPPSTILSGSLGMTTGLMVALEAFAGTDLTLHVTGRPFRMSEGEFAGIVRKYSTHANIHFHGTLPLPQYKTLLDNCDIALSLRNPEDTEHRYNFPSKILEYLGTSQIVVSSLDYKELPPNMLIHCSFDPDSLLAAVRSIAASDDGWISSWRKQVSEALTSHFTEDAFEIKLAELMRG